MFETIKRSWQRFKADPPGQRFQQQFKRRHAVARTLLQKALVVGGGVLLTGVGIFLFFLPGPGVLFVLLGAVLIAQQSITVARDWTGPKFACESCSLRASARGVASLRH